MTGTGAPPLVVVSVLNWNTAEASLRCLAALARLEYPHVRVVLVDNASSDDSVARIRARHPTLCVLCNARNDGFAGGHAQSLEQARAWSAAALWLVNSDAEVEPDALAQLVAAWQQHGMAVYGGAALKRVPGGQTVLNFPARFLDPGLKPGALGRDRPILFDDGWSGRPPMRVAAVPGSCLLLPLQVVDQHGWMDDDWFLYCEELDYCLRLRAAGVPSILVPQARVWHGGGGSHQARPAVTDCVQYYQARNEIVLLRRHRGRGEALLVALKKLLRALYAAVARPARGRMIVLGVVDALRGRLGKRHAPEQALQRDRRAAGAP